MSLNTAGAKGFQHSPSALQKHTAQSDIILRTFLVTAEAGEHLSVEELHRLVKHKDPRISLTAVYRPSSCWAVAAWLTNWNRTPARVNVSMQTGGIKWNHTKFITLGPEHVGPFLTAFGECWFVGKLKGNAGACGFAREDIGKRLYLVDGDLVLESEADKRKRERRAAARGNRGRAHLAAIFS